MRKSVWAIIALTVVTVGCSSLENNARDSFYALKGAIEAGQVRHLSECKADPTGQVCVAINKGVDGQNALGTAIDTYCGWAAGTPPNDPSLKCVPVKSAKAALEAAIANANQLTTEVKGTL